MLVSLQFFTFDLIRKIYTLYKDKSIKINGKMEWWKIGINKYTTQRIAELAQRTAKREKKEMRGETKTAKERKKKPRIHGLKTNALKELKIMNYNSGR